MFLTGWLVFGLIFTAAARQPDDCLPNGCTNLLTGTCWGDSESEQCYQCYSGSFCQVYLGEECVVNAEINSPFLMQTYWQQRGESPTVTLPLDWAASYQGPDVYTQTKDQIRKLHALVQNAETDGYQIVVGYGATQLSAAIFYAFSRKAMEEQTTYQVFSETPHYQNFPEFVQFGNIDTPYPLVWNETLWGNVEVDAENVIQVMNSPSNPDGAIRQPVLNDKSRVVCDIVNNWPYNALPIQKYDCDLMLFSLSKIANAGFRFGWALIKDPVVHEHMLHFIDALTQGISAGNQAWAITMIQDMLDTDGEIFRWVRSELSVRWVSLFNIFSNCRIVTTEGIPARAVINSHSGRLEGPMLYLEFVSDSGVELDGRRILGTQAGVLGYSSLVYFSDNNSVRVNMLESPSTWDLMEERFSRFCVSHGKEMLFAMKD